MKNASQIVRACQKNAIPPRMARKKHLSQYLQVGGIPPTIAIACTPYKRKGKWIPPIFATDIPPINAREYPLQSQEKIWTVDHIYEAEKLYI